VKTGRASVINDGDKKDPVYAATFSPDGHRFAAVGDDRRLRVWRTTDLHLESEQRVSRNALYAVAFLPRLDRVAVAGEDDRVYLIEALRR
jgi:WD40 repeat protein